MMPLKSGIMACRQPQIPKYSNSQKGRVAFSFQRTRTSGLCSSSAVSKNRLWFCSEGVPLVGLEVRSIFCFPTYRQWPRLWMREQWLSLMGNG